MDEFANLEKRIAELQKKIAQVKRENLALIKKNIRHQKTMLELSDRRSELINKVACTTDKQHEIHQCKVISLFP